MCLYALRTFLLCRGRSMNRVLLDVENEERKKMKEKKNGGKEKRLGRTKSLRSARGFSLLFKSHANKDVLYSVGTEIY